MCVSAAAWVSKITLTKYICRRCECLYIFSIDIYKYTTPTQIKRITRTTDVMYSTEL